MSILDLSTFKSIYHRKSDGRMFFAKPIVPGTYKIYDTVTHEFTEISKSALNSKYKGCKSNKKTPFLVKGIDGWRVRELKKKGIDIIVKPYKDSEEFDL